MGSFSLNPRRMYREPVGPDQWNPRASHRPSGQRGLHGQGVPPRPHQHLPDSAAQQAGQNVLTTISLLVTDSARVFVPGILTEGEGSVQLTSLGLTSSEYLLLILIIYLSLLQNKPS